MATEAYTPPQTLSEETIAQERVRRRRTLLRRCGMLLMITYLLIIIAPMVVSLLYNLGVIPLELDFWVVNKEGVKEKSQGLVNAFIAGVSLILIVSTLLCLGAYQMWQLQGNFWVRATTVAALLPFSLVFWPFTFTLGIIALLVQLREDPELLYNHE